MRHLTDQEIEVVMALLREVKVQEGSDMLWVEIKDTHQGKVRKQLFLRIQPPVE